MDSTKAFLRAWAWKREHRPDKLSTCMLWLLAWHCTSLCFALVVLSLLLLTGMRKIAALTGVHFQCTERALSAHTSTSYMLAMRARARHA